MIPKTLSSEATAHIAAALLVHRKGLARRGVSGPQDLIDFTDSTLEAHHGGVGFVAVFNPKGTEGTADVRYVGDTPQPDQGATDLLTQKAAAELAGVHPKTVKRAIDRDELEAVGPKGRRRVRRSALADWSAHV